MLSQIVRFHCFLWPSNIPLYTCTTTFKKYILLIMLSQLSHFPLYSPPLCTAPATCISSPPLSSCPRVIQISSLASTIPILFLPSPCLFCTYHLCFLFPVNFPPLLPSPSLLITLPVISLSVILFLF